MLRKAKRAKTLLDPVLGGKVFLADAGKLLIEDFRFTGATS
jgi:hypothetical protein